MCAITKRSTLLKSTIEQVSAFVLSRFFDKNFEISTKKDGSDLTTVDLKAENLAKTAILGAFPEDGFLGEEHGEVEGTSGFRWVVDPIDGTASFVRGVPLFGTLIGLEHNGEPIAGEVRIPALQESISAVRGEGVTLQINKSANVSTTESLDEALICTTSYDYYKQIHKSSIPNF